MGVYPVNAVVNAIVWVSTGSQVLQRAHPRDSVLAYASEIRKSVEKLKDPRFIKDMVADVAKIQSQVAWDKSGQDIGSAREGCLIASISRG